MSFWFTYAQLGVLIFGGKMPVAGNNQELDYSRYGQGNMYILNFNDMGYSFSTLFCCLRISDFDVVSQGFEIVTNSRLVRLYFLFWYMMGTLLFFNILKSYFICVFEPGKDKGDASESKNSRNSDVTIEEDQETSKVDVGENDTEYNIKEEESETEKKGRKRNISLSFANYTPSTLRNSLCDDEEVQDASSLSLITGATT